MSKRLTAARNSVARTESTLAKRAERLEKTVASGEARIARAEAALRKAQERLQAARANAEKARAKQEKDLADTTTRLEEARKRVASLECQPTKVVPPAGVVATESGEERPVSKQAVDTVKGIVGRRRKGVLAPLDGAEAQAVLEALEGGGNVGDAFTLRIRCRKMAFRLLVEEGLKFETA